MHSVCVLAYVVEHGARKGSTVVAETSKAAHPSAWPAPRRLHICSSDMVSGRIELIECAEKI